VLQSLNEELYHSIHLTAHVHVELAGCVLCAVVASNQVLLLVTSALRASTATISAAQMHSKLRHRHQLAHQSVSSVSTTVTQLCAWLKVNTHKVSTLLPTHT
jgi:hypothetical protein